MNVVSKAAIHLTAFAGCVLCAFSVGHAESDDEASDDSDRGGNKVESTKDAVPVKDSGRFFVDKQDTAATDEKTLVQGNFVASSFIYTESGGQLSGIGPGGSVGGDLNSKNSRIFTDLRTQLDARHIKGGRWDFRFDARGRFVAGGGAVNPATPIVKVGTGVQSGAFGKNELELKDAWLVRSGERTDVFLGRQMIADLGAIKIDGLRIDYASSSKFTLLGFAGAYPYRGSRSVFTDYPKLVDAKGASLGRTPPVATGAGAAYRTQVAYGAVGVVAIVPLKGAAPRVYATTNGYWRGIKADVYHFGLIDLFGPAGFALTNVSVGGNYKPSPRLRLTAGLNRNDIDTLGIQAQSFLQDDATSGVNSVALRRYATNQVRAGVSAGLGQSQRFELSVSTALRFRPAIALKPVDGSPELAVALPAEKGVEIHGGVVDRRSVGGLRIGLDASRFFGLGSVSFSRQESFSVRLGVSRDFKAGRGQFEAEGSYLKSTDDAASLCADILTCYGNSNSSTVQGGATLYYRLKSNIFAMGSLFVALQNVSRTDAMTTTADPALRSTSGFLRLAYRY
jgi:hypothetical protein